jgi:tetratricopeptide (TPR) repeat protein
MACLCVVLLIAALTSQLAAQVPGAGSSTTLSPLVQQADSAYRQRQFQQVIELATQALSQSRDAAALYLRASARVELGISQRNQQLIREGIEDARQAIQSDTAQTADYYLPYLYGMTHLTQFEGDKSHAETAVQVATQMLSRDGLSVETRANLFYQRGLARVQMQVFTEAAEDFAQAIASTPNHLASYLARADALGQAKDFTQAEAAYAAAIAQFPANPIVYNNRGMFYQSQKVPAKAIEDFTQAIALDGTQYQAYLNRGFVQMNSGNPAAALQDFSRVLELRPGHGPAFSMRGTANLLAGQPVAAINDYLKVIEIDPRSASARADIGFAYFFARHYDTAAQAFEQAISLAPQMKYLNPWRYAALTLAGKRPEADALYVTIPQKPADSRDWFDMLTLYFMGQLESRDLLAAVDSRDGTLRDAQLCEAYYFIGLKLESAGEGDPARYYRRALQAQSTQLSAYRAARFALDELQKRQ